MLFGTKNPSPVFHVEGNNIIYSARLRRDVTMDLFLPASYPYSRRKFPFLILNDGQDAEAIRLKSALSRLTRTEQMQEIIVFAVHAGDRMQEYGVSSHPDFKKRGAKAKLYSGFIVEELMPLLTSNFRLDANSGFNAIAGFSLGGLSAFDIGWNHPRLFQRIGVFSGSLWWRSRSYEDGYDEARDRIIHNRVRSASPNSTLRGELRSHLRFWFQTGTLDETADRNHNGVIDSIDDTLDLICELVKKGYRPYRDIEYVEIENGKHNQQTWAKALPMFLKWGFPKI
ncbi:MAG TPA: alpha/beta hydrolase-fold protein [Chitinophagales bacterium]|nr:alpha/beta hydrolase-fold protein [Chitinophagales bacterium]